jgi:hypothetical protein
MDPTTGQVTITVNPPGGGGPWLQNFQVTSLHSAPTDGDKAYRVTRVGDRWVPVKEIPSNLPQLMTSFQGRERELECRADREIHRSS